MAWTEGLNMFLHKSNSRNWKYTNVQIEFDYDDKFLTLELE